MTQISKQIAIYTSLLLVFATFTLISPFYPKIAQDKGLSLWMIGIMFSLNPLAQLITSIFLGRYMVRIGRKKIVISTFLFTSASMIVLSPIEEVDLATLVILTVIARILSGIGAGCILTSITTIFISDYPDDLQTMLGRMEAAVGVGLIAGPLIGTALYLINLLAALLIVGLLILAFSPFAWNMLGTFKEYDVKNLHIDRIKLFMKPVRSI